MEIIAEIRRRHLVQGEKISAIARDLNLCRQTVRKHINTEAELVYQRREQPASKLGPVMTILDQWLELEATLPKRQRRTAQRPFECLQSEAGYVGSYDRVQKYVKRWKDRQKASPKVTQA